MFYTLLTNIGKAKLANATALGTTVQLTHIAVGDGNGAAIIPVDTATVLTHEVWRAALNSIAVDPANTNWIVAEGYIPSTSGGFTVREVGLFDIDGDLIAIGSYPDTYKPTLANGSAKDLYIKVIIEVTNSSTVTLKIDPAVVLSTRSYVDSKVVEHEGKADPHSQYLTIDKIHAAPFESTLGGNDEWAIWDSFTGLLRKISVTGFISYLASIFVQPSQLFGFKNYIINGNFDVWQYGTNQTSNGYGSDDRWSNANVGSTKTHSKTGATLPTGEIANTSNTVVSSVNGVSNRVNKTQFIENVFRLAGKTVTLSFYAKADSSKNIAIEFEQNFGTGGAPSAQVNSIGSQLVALTTSWQKYSITVNIPSASSKTIGTDGVHTSSTAINFWFDAGSNLNARTASLGQQSGTFSIAKIQIEEGSVATPFENRPYGLELSLCQRYYERFVAGTTSALIASGYMLSPTQPMVVFPCVTKRVIPTIAIPNISTWRVNQNSNNSLTCTGFSSGLTSVSSIGLILTVVGGTTNLPCVMLSNAVGAYIELSAEL